MGFDNFAENLRRCRKFKSEHLNNVMDDYVSDPIREQAPAMQPQPHNIAMGGMPNNMSNQ